MYNITISYNAMCIIPHKQPKCQYEFKFGVNKYMIVKFI